MSRTSQSPRKVARWALKVGEGSLRPYAHKYAPRKFTQPQLLALLVLRTWLDASYRRTEAIIADWSDLRAELGLSKTPDHTTLCRAARRLLRSDLARSLLGQAARAALGRRRCIERAAVDSTGLQLGHVSDYFVRRRSREANVWQTTRYRRFGKLTLLVDCTSHIILGALPERGPKPDVNRLVDALDGLIDGVVIETLLADAGYDSEANHVYARDEHGIRSIIPAASGRPTRKPASGKHRRLMQQLFQRAERLRYGQRWQVETVNFMIKHNLTDELTAQTYWSQCRQMWLLAITHNVMIALCSMRFATGQVGSRFNVDGLGRKRG